MDYQPIIEFIRFLYPNREIVPLHEPYFGGNEKRYVLDCIESTFVSSVGKYVDHFEEMIRDFTGAKYAIATMNGTAALHIALKLVGVQQGDLVITQPLTFVATCNAITYCGAEPVFVDVDPETLGMSPDSLESWLGQNVDIVDKGLGGLETQYSKLSQPSQPYLAIHKATKRHIAACVPMHTFGHPCKIDRITEICQRYHIPVVEDAAESIGSYYKGQHTGTFGKLGILSFNGNKTITTGGGGMILTNDDELGPLAKHITTTAKKPHLWKFEHNMIGYNYRLPNINAALGCAQMEMLPEILKNKRETAKNYQVFFNNLKDVTFIQEPSDSIANYWLNAILLKNEEERNIFLEQTHSQKVNCRPAWTLMNKLPMFSKSICSDLLESYKVEEKLVNIPSSYNKHFKK